jgi:ABC-type Fe3+/spermidine/putrescine transport system ATPase subunit
MLLEISNIEKTYDNAPLLQGVSFSVDSGETICLLGRSGSGKSTLLRIIAGLESAEGGQILWEGQDYSNVPVHQRGFGLMFQDYALFPHRTVEQNVAFGLLMQNSSQEETRERTRQMLALVHMESFASRKVTDLSGGEQQRIALARALAPRPKLLMLDEPLGALDKTLKHALLDELRDIIRTTQIPAIYVTHDQEEAYSIADRLVLLNSGRVEQVGSPEEVFRQPVSAWVADFLGLGNLIPAEGGSGKNGNFITEIGEFTLPQCEKKLADGEKLALLLRPDSPGLEINLSPREPLSNPGYISLVGEVRETVFTNGEYRISVRINQITLHFLSETRFNNGEMVAISIPTEEIKCL